MKKYLFTLFCLPLLVFATEEEAFTNLQSLYQNQNWNKIISNSAIMVKEFPQSIFSKDVLFFTGVAYFHIDDPSIANDYLSKFLEKEGNSRFFEDALKYKFFIAEKFESGYYGHLWGIAALPRLESMWQEAYQLYDEVIMTLPRSEVAAKAMFRKSCMYLNDEKFDESVDGFSNLIRRFPSNTLAQEAYVQIMKVYKKQIKVGYLDPKCYEFALLNKKKFDLAYPSSPLKVEMEEAELDIIDLYAEDVYKSALFFDKKRKIDSAKMYLQALIAKYPTSRYASLAVQKIAAYNLDSYKQLKSATDTALLVGAE